MRASHRKPEDCCEIGERVATFNVIATTNIARLARCAALGKIDRTRADDAIAQRQAHVNFRLQRQELADDGQCA